MKTRSLYLLTLATTILLSSQAAAQQKKTNEVPQPPQLVRTTTRNEVRRFPYGGTVTIVGPPAGSISIEGWQRNEVEVRAEIQLRADSEADLDKLALVNTFVLDEDMDHIRILSTGTHDKAFMRSVARKFPKNLLGLPWQIDFRIRVPALAAVEINAGRGPISLSAIEGNIRISATESEATLSPLGGTLSVTIAKGKVNLSVPTKSWRGVGTDVRVAIGEVNVEFVPGFNGDVDAEILRAGLITDSFGLEAREKPGITPQKIKGRAGAGGAAFALTVGDGVIQIKKKIMSE